VASGTSKLKSNLIFLKKNIFLQCVASGASKTQIQPKFFGKKIFFCSVWRLVQKKQQKTIEATVSAHF
jgi:hypothetical protein